MCPSTLWFHCELVVVCSPIGSVFLLDVGFWCLIPGCSGLLGLQNSSCPLAVHWFLFAYLSGHSKYFQ